MSLTRGIRIVGRFEIVAPLGAGSMGEVYHAHDLKLGRDVALKLLSPALAASHKHLRRFEREARAGSLQAGLEAARRELAAAGIEPEYLEARDATSLEPATKLNGSPVLVAVAARVGAARLIDNILITP